MTKTITTKMLRLLVRQHGLKTVVRLLSEMAHDAGQKEDALCRYEDKVSPFHRHGDTLFEASQKLPDEPFWE